VNVKHFLRALRDVGALARMFACNNAQLARTL
jgi:hypothetical protein